MPIRLATRDDVPAVLNVLDGGGLQTSIEETRRAIERGEGLVATGPSSATVVGAMVLEGAEIRVIAVRPGRRGQGVGTALVEAGLHVRKRLVAHFHESVSPFWQSLAFDCERIVGTDRFRGVRSAEPDD